MKKTLSFIIAVAIIASAFAAFALNTAAATTGTLTVTSQGVPIGEVEVGNEFIYHVALDSAGYGVSGGEGELRCNPAYAEVVEYGEARRDGTINRDAYTFPLRIRNSSLVTNYNASDNRIKYNFSKGTSGVGAFTEEDHFFKVRLKAIAPGTVEIRHYLTSLSNITNNKIIKLVQFDKGNDKLDPTPRTVSSIEPATAFIGDADGDYDLTILDATFIQRATAGVDSTYKMENADVNGDGEVNLKDALNILRYKAGIATDTRVGEWIFESEQ